VSASLIYIALVALSHLLVDHPRKGELVKSSAPCTTW
jgi:hypothetical protein